MDNKVDGLKQEQDFLKHLTTLSTGSILLLVTFLERLFAQPTWTPLIAVSLIGYTLSIIGSLIIHFLSIAEIQGAYTPDSRMSSIEAILFLLCFGGFITGTSSLVVFAIKNLP